MADKEDSRLGNMEEPKAYSGKDWGILLEKIGVTVRELNRDLRT